MVHFDETEAADVTFSVTAIEPDCIELQRESERGVTVYFDAPEDAVRRWSAWTTAHTSGLSCASLSHDKR